MATQKSSSSTGHLQDLDLVSFSVYSFHCSCFGKRLRRYNFLKAAFNFLRSYKSITWWRERERFRDVCRWRRKWYRWWMWCRIGWKQSSRSRLGVAAQWRSWVRSTLWFRIKGRGLLCRRISVVPNSSRIGPKLENTNLLVLLSTPPVEFFKLFITDLFITKMAEQTNFYAVQRGAPGSFKQLSDGS